MRNIILIIYIFVSYLTYSFGQNEINESSSWKKIDWVEKIDIPNINRIYSAKNDLLMFNIRDANIGQVAVTFKNSDFNKLQNLNIYLEDTISSPFFLNYRKSIEELPEAGTSFENVYFDSKTGKPLENDWHTLNILNVIPIGFQIFVNENHFSSRMFVDNNDENLIFIKPKSQKLMQSFDKKLITGKLEFVLDLLDYYALKDFLGFEIYPIDGFEINIEYQYTLP